MVLIDKTVLFLAFILLFLAVATPITEAAAEPEPEVAVEPEGEASPEPEGEATAEPESEAEPEGETTVESMQKASAAEVLIPPISLLVAVILGAIYLSLKSHSYLWKPTLNKAWSLCTCRGRLRKGNVPVSAVKTIQQTGQLIISDPPTAHESADKGQTSPVKQIEPISPLFSDFDREVMRKMKTFYNRPTELFQICLPTFLSLGICPIAMFLYGPLVNFFWPDTQMPDINEAIGSFLTPAGLVYATTFGFAFQQALDKQLEIYLKMSQEIGMVDQMATLSLKLNVPTLDMRLRYLKAIKAEVICMMMNVQDRTTEDYEHTPTENIIVQIWSILDITREANKIIDYHRAIVDRTLLEIISDHVISLNSICSDRMMTLHSRIHPAKWMFMEALGFLTFFGVFLLKASSYRLELAMCIMTVFSISMLCYVISDLDSPFSGFFRVDMTTLSEVAEHLEIMYNNVHKGDIEVPLYPDKTKRE